MNFTSKIIKLLTNSDYRFLLLSSFGIYDRMTDFEFLKRKYKSSMKKELNLEKPLTFNEKLQWLKLYDHNPVYTKLVDKYLVREYIKETLGEEYLIPLLGVWESEEQIDFNLLPNKFVLKCNHNSGLGMYICKNKEEINESKIKNGLKKGLKQDYYMTGREWPYKNVKRKIIAEKFMSNNSNNELEENELTDYKFFCFNGYVDNVMVCIERYTGDPKFYFFNKDWNLLRLNIRGKNAPKDFTLPKPTCMDEMFEIASKLSKGIPFVRVDLYVCNNKIYFGEMTFYPQSGFDDKILPETDLYLGNLIDLNLVKERNR